MSIPMYMLLGQSINGTRMGFLLLQRASYPFVKENFNFAAAEAMAAQKPVILSPGNAPRRAAWFAVAGS